MRSARLLAWSFALFLFVPSVAMAQPDTARRDAEARFKEGLARVQSGDFEAARLAFVQAYAVLKSADVLWNLALSEMKSNHPLEALAHFKEYMRDARTSEPDRAKARKYVDELHARVGRVTVDAPAGATIVVDGRTLPQVAPLGEPVDVTPGEHFVEARIGERSRSMRLDAAAGVVVVAQFRADELSGGAGAAGAAGAGGASTAPVNGGSNGVVSPPPEEKADQTARYVVSGALVGVGLIAAGTAVAFAISSSSSKDEADRLLSGAAPNVCARNATPDCAALDDARRSEIDKANMALGLGIASAGLVAGGVATFFLWPKGGNTSAARGVRVSPLAGNVTGASISTSF